VSITVTGRDAFGNPTSLSASDIALTADPPVAITDVSVKPTSDDTAVSVAFGAEGEGRVVLAICGVSVGSWATVPANPPVVGLVAVGLPADGVLSSVQVGEPLSINVMAVGASGQKARLLDFY
jgi:hypothetical protein